MTAKSKDAIKAFFETGDKPTQSQFIDLIDSFVDKNGPVGSLETIASGLSTGFTYFTAGVPSLISYATTAQGNAGSDASTIMTPVVVRNAISTYALTSANFSSTAQGNAGLDNTTIMTPVLAKNAINTLSGIIQVATTAYATNGDLTTVIPLDDSIPQKTEGTQVLSITFTPKSATSTIEIEFVGFGAASSASVFIVALFKDTGADALAVSTMIAGGASLPDCITLKHSEASGSTSARTYKINVGMNTGSCRLNGTLSARLFGGIASSRLMIREINA
jgi:hypothetical protein